MSIKFWEDRGSLEVYVRFDEPKPMTNSVVWLVYSDGTPVHSGGLVSNAGSRFGNVAPMEAARAGVELNNGKISADSLAQICAEMAKRIQGD